MAKRKNQPKTSTKSTACCTCPPPSPLKAGLAFGIVWGIGVLLLGLIATYAEGYGSPVMELIGSVYMGYEATIKGSFLGLLWGFIDGFLGGFLIVYVYNWLNKK